MYETTTKKLIVSLVSLIVSSPYMLSQVSTIGPILLTNVKNASVNFFAWRTGSTSSCSSY